MKRRTQKHLYHIHEAIAAILECAAGKSFDDYRETRMLRSAIEREFLIIGEALVRLRRDDPTALASLSDVPSIIAFRNIVVHAYDSIDNSRVWNIVEHHLPVLQDEVEALITATDNLPPSEEE